LYKMEDYRKLLAKTAVAELKDQLRGAKIRGFSKMKKSEIVDLLVSKKQYSQPTSQAHEAYVAEKMETKSVETQTAPAPAPVPTPAPAKKVAKPKVVKEKVAKPKAVAVA
jgi:hypothetical protein